MTFKRDTGYPRSLTGWTGVPVSGVTAGVRVRQGVTTFFNDLGYYDYLDRGYKVF